ncbi:MAG: DUF6444 domain-containing protein [Thermoguttaceae bacterium]
MFPSPNSGKFVKRYPFTLKSSIASNIESVVHCGMDAKDKRIAVLEKNSQTSSKNPSSDIIKPQKPKPKDENGNIAKRKIGAQKGHKQNLRKLISPGLVDTLAKLDLTKCPDCGHRLKLQKTEPKTTQQIELVEKPVSVTEYQ